MNKMRPTLAVVLFLVGQSLAGEVPAMTPASPSNGQLLERLQQLESETQMLRAELGQIQNHPVPLPPVGGPQFSTVSALAADGEVDYVTWDEVRSEMKDLAWKKGEFKIVPYGILWGTMSYETSRTYLGDYTLWAISADDEGENALHFNGKGTRLGIDVSGPRLPFFCCAKSGGKVEFDFEGNFTIENKPGVLLRHAYWEVKNDDFRFLMGQTWDVISPLYPKCIMYSVYWGAGNIGYRRAQMRYERYFTMSDMWQLELQGALATDAGQDFVNGAVPVNGDHAGWPIVEMRVGTKIGNQRPIALGVSGHIGEEIFDFVGFDDTPRQTWSLNADVNVPITDRFGFQGEFFTGTNLKTFLGGIVQGVNVGGTDAEIRSSGGWANVYYDLTPRLHCAAGYTIDDPLDADITTANGRLYNQAYWGNVTFDVTKKFMLGLEVGQWKTLFTDRAPGDSTRFEFAGKYAF
jgi:hypothetical protein